MSLRDGSFGELKVPLAWTAAVALAVAGVVAIALLMSDRRETFQAETYGATRKAADAIAAPVSGVLATPIRWVGDGINGVRGYFFAVSENRRLKAELEDMRRWRDTAIALQDTNNRYQTLLGLRTDPPIPMVGARIITDSRGPFANTRLASAGKDKGVKPGQPVMSENGLVGRVIGVTTGVSRVLLLTDVASRTPVMIDRTNARAILTGDGSANPKLDYLRGRDPVREGDRILTSGDGGLLPRGLPVGVAVKGIDGGWRVALASEAAPIDYVRILLFEDFSQLADFQELGNMEPPPPTDGAAPTVGVGVDAAPAPVAPSPAQGRPPPPAAAAPRASAPAGAPPSPQPRPAPSPPTVRAPGPGAQPTPQPGNSPPAARPPAANASAAPQERPAAPVPQPTPPPRAAPTPAPAAPAEPPQ